MVFGKDSNLRDNRKSHTLSHVRCVTFFEDYNQFLPPPPLLLHTSFLPLFPPLPCSSVQVKIDAAQMKEQEALRKQLQQEQDLLQTFQEAQDEKLKTQHVKERTALDEKVELSKKELEKEVCGKRGC